MTIRSRTTARGMAATLALTGVSAATHGTTWAVAAETSTETEATTKEGA